MKILFRYSKSIVRIRQTLELLEKDIIELDEAAIKKKNRILDFNRILNDCNELIPQKDDVLCELGKEKLKFGKELNLLMDHIEELKLTVEPYTISIRKVKKMITQVTKYHFIINMIYLFTLQTRICRKKRIMYR